MAACAPTEKVRLSWGLSLSSRASMRIDTVSVVVTKNPQQTLTAQGVRGRREKRYDVSPRAVQRTVGAGRKVREVPGGTRQQAHRENGGFRAYGEPPLAVSVSDCAICRATGFQVVCGERDGMLRGNGNPGYRTRRFPGVIDGRDSHGSGLVFWVDQPQPADLVERCFPG